jgi:Ion channel
MAARIERVHEAMASERGLTLLLALLVLAIFVFPTLGLEGSDELLYADIMFSVVLVAGVAAASPDRKTRLLVASVALVALVVKWGSWLSIGAALQPWRAPTTLLTEFLFALAILRRVLGAGRVTSHRVQGAVVVYLLLGLSWANAYHIVEFLHPGSFDSQVAGPLTITDWMYFSFVTLTTVGYGDVTPVHRVARVLAVGEALTGQLYLAVLLARLVSLEIVARSESRGAGDPPD